MSLMRVDIYNQSLVLQETLIANGLVELPPNAVVSPQSSQYMNDAVNMGITERIGHLSMFCVAGDGAFTGVPIAYCHDLTGDGTNTDWAKNTSPVTSTDATYTDTPRPPGATTPFAWTATASRKQEAIVESATAAGVPTSGANSVMLAGRVDGVIDSTSASKTPFDHSFLYSTNQGIAYTVGSDNTTNNCRMVYQNYCPVQQLRPGSSNRLTRSDFDGTNVGIRANEGSGAFESRVMSHWIESLTCDSIVQDGIHVQAFTSGGGELLAAGVYGAGTHPKPATAWPADLTTNTGDTDFPGDGSYISANRNKASPAVAIIMDNQTIAQTGEAVTVPMGHGEMWMAYKPSGTPSAAGTIMEMVFINSVAGSGSSSTFKVKNNTSGKLDLYEKPIGGSDTLKTSGTYTLSTTDIQFIRLYVSSQLPALLMGKSKTRAVVEEVFEPKRKSVFFIGTPPTPPSVGTRRRQAQII